jgi:uncharacterized protein YndB with AHSA1/START domain
MKLILSIVVVLALFPCASAAVTDVAANGFTIELQQAISAPPDKVYAVLIQPSGWWSSAHTFSGSAANLTLEPRAGGCFCEKLPSGGSVQHLSVLSVMPGKMLRLSGMLGPFQGVAGNGVMTWTLLSDKGGTQLKLSYQIAGYDGMKIGGSGMDVWSKAADAMLSEQLVRLKHDVETVKAE